MSAPSSSLTQATAAAAMAATTPLCPVSVPINSTPSVSLSCPLYPVSLSAVSPSLALTRPRSHSQSLRSGATKASAPMSNPSVSPSPVRLSLGRSLFFRSLCLSHSVGPSLIWPDQGGSTQNRGLLFAVSLSHSLFDLRRQRLWRREAYWVGVLRASESGWCEIVFCMCNCVPSQSAAVKCNLFGNLSMQLNLKYKGGKKEGRNVPNEWIYGA